MTSLLETPSADSQKGRGKKRRKSQPAERKISTFAYETIGPKGKKVRKTIQAFTLAEAKFALDGQGLQVLSLTRHVPWYALEFGTVVPGAILLQATRQLASFAQAGIPVAQGLAILADTIEHKRMAETLRQVHDEILAGTTFTEAVSHHPKIFPTYYRAILGAAERTGDLAGALVTLNSYLEREMRSRRAIKSAMYYPAALIGLAIIAIAVLSALVLPRFEVFFASLDVELPLTTRMMLNSTRFLTAYWWLLLAAGLGAFAAFQAFIRTTAGRLIVDIVKLRLPVIGKLLQLVAVERFSRVLSTLVHTAVPLPEALLMAGNATGNQAFINAIHHAHAGVLAGRGLAGPLSETKMFPSAAVQIFHVGEQSQRLEDQLNQASSFYSDELDHRLRTFTSLLEPFVLLLVGGGVGFVAVALISAMYGIYRGVQ